MFMVVLFVVRKKVYELENICSKLSGLVLNIDKFFFFLYFLVVVIVCMVLISIFNDFVFLFMFSFECEFIDLLVFVVFFDFLSIKKDSVCFDFGLLRFFLYYSVLSVVNLYIFSL